jgi:glycosyltransferase involved in cell wall biosynthesis
MIAALAKNFDLVSVYSTHVGNYLLPKNVLVKGTGGGNFKQRYLAVVRLLLLGLRTISLRQPPAVLFHMNIKAAAILAPILKIRNISTTLWYSHASSSLLLRWSNFWVKNVITTSKTAYPLKHLKITPIGQAVDSNLFPLSPSNSVTIRDSISFLHVGRVSKVKYIEELIDAISLLNIKRSKLSLIGEANSAEDKKYLGELRARCDQVGVVINYLGGIERENLQEFYSKADICFSGTRKAIDKSAIEAAYCGTLIVSPNVELLDILGLKAMYENELDVLSYSIGVQIKYLLSQNSKSLRSIRLRQRNFAISNCDMQNQMILVSKIIRNV